VQLASGGGSWSTLSDRNTKEHFQAVDSQAVLVQLAQLPRTSWNYRAQDDEIRHRGPTAQDFYAAFGVGEDDMHISTVDANGVALLAIQGLYTFSQEQAAQITELRKANTALGSEIKN
jgi:hypothetical protein